MQGICTTGRVIDSHRFGITLETWKVGRISHAPYTSAEEPCLVGRWLGPFAVEKFKKDFGPKSFGSSVRSKKIAFKDVKTTVKGEEAFVSELNLQLRLLSNFLRVW